MRIKRQTIKRPAQHPYARIVASPLALPYNTKIHPRIRGNGYQSYAPDIKRVMLGILSRGNPRCPE